MMYINYIKFDVEEICACIDTEINVLTVWRGNFYRSYNITYLADIKCLLVPRDIEHHSKSVARTMCSDFNVISDSYTFETIKKDHITRLYNEIMPSLPNVLPDDIKRHIILHNAPNWIHLSLPSLPQISMEMCDKMNVKMLDLNNIKCDNRFMFESCEIYDRKEIVWKD